MTYYSIEIHQLFTYLIGINMLMNVVNIALAIAVVKKCQNEFQEVQRNHLLNWSNRDTMRIWFVCFAILVSMAALMVNSQSVLTLSIVPYDRLAYGIKYRYVQIATTMVVALYHVLLLKEKRKDDR